MKVLTISWEFPPRLIGGLARHVYELSRALSASGVEMHIITPRVEGSPNFENMDGAYIYRVGAPFPGVKNFKAWTYGFNTEVISNAVKIHSFTGGFDLVHAHDWLVAYSGRALSKIFNIPLVTTIHATEHGRNMGLHNRMQKEIHDTEYNLVTDSQRVICCSQYMKHEITQLFGLPENLISVIPNGVTGTSDSKLMYSALRVSGIKEEDRIIFFIGRLVPEKGVETLIRAFAPVSGLIPDARLVIGGRGPQEPILRQLAADLGISDRVVFTGFISDKARDRIFHWAEAAVFPSYYEPFGIVALEAMTFGTPVIVSNVGGLAEIVEDGINGLKVEAGDEAALSEALLKILNSRSLSTNLRYHAHHAIETKYSWHTIAEQTKQVYQQAAAPLRKREVG